MKTYHKKTLTRKAGYTFFRKWDENIAICGEFISFALDKWINEYRDFSVTIDIRVKNPKEKGFIRILNPESEGNRVVFAMRKKTSKRFVLCFNEIHFLEYTLNSPKVFWVRVQEIS